MISVDIKARIGEIRFKGDKSCIFIIETEGENELQCTITKQNIHLADLVKEGQEIELKGNISAYRKIKNETEYINNILCVNSITQAEQEQKAN
jgi:exonuclease VII large subunit